MFEKLAIDNANEIEDVQKVFDRMDLTNVFWNGIDFMIKNNELVNIQINAQVRKGKSTLGCSIGENIAKLLVKYNKKPKEFEFKINNIVRSQQEYSDIMKRGNLSNDIILIDEFDAMDDTGENSSVEQKLREKMSDIFAGLYVHKVSCSPNDVIDKNADIFIEIIATNKERRETLTHIYFNLLQNGVKTKIPIGKCVFSVAKVINNWVNFEPTFVNNYELNNMISQGKKLSKNELSKLEKENKLIEEYRKKDYYIEYMIRKYFKMNLTTKEGIYNSRELDNAEIILDIVNQLKDMAKHTDSFDINMVKAYTDIVARKRKMVLSLIGKKEIIDKAMGILLQYKALQKNLKLIEKEEKKIRILNKSYSKEIKELNKAKTSDNVKEIMAKEIIYQKEYKNDTFKDKMDVLSKVNNQISMNINALREDLEYKIELKKKYMEQISK